MRVLGCGSWLHLREWLESGESRLINANFCEKFLLCKCCARRRAGKLVTAYEPKVAAVMEEHPGLIPVMITLTVKNGEDLGERLEHFKGAWRKMVETRRACMSKTSRHQKIEWCKVRGSLRAIEVSRKEKTGWHPHGHIFALVDSYIDQAKLSDEWKRFTGDSFIVGITECKNGILPGLIECVKYSTKFSDLSPDQVWHVFETAKGSRFFDPQGVLRGVPEPDINSDEIDDLTGPYRDLIAMWMWGKGGYDLQAVPKEMPTSPSNPNPKKPNPRQMPKFKRTVK